MTAGGRLPRLAGAIVDKAPARGQRNFRRYFYGQICSVLGTFIQAVALSWLVYRITGSPALLGLTAFLSQAPQLVVSPLAGVLAESIGWPTFFIVSTVLALPALGML